MRTPCKIRALLLAFLLLGSEVAVAAAPNAEGMLVGASAVLVLALVLLIYTTRRAMCESARPSGKIPIDPADGPWKFDWSEHAFQSLVENAADPIFRYDRDCRRLYANPAAARLTKVSSELLIGNTPDDQALLEPEQGRRLMDAIRRVFASGEKSELLLEQVAPDGQHRDYHLLLIPERTGDGEAETVFVTSRDVTEMRRVEACRSQYLDVAPGLFYTLIHHPHGAYVMSFANAGVYDVYGLEAETAMKDFSSLLALVHPDDVAMRQHELDKSAGDLTPFHVEYRIVHPRKGLRWLEAHALPQSQPNGGTRWDGFVHDITERKLLDELTRKHQQEFRALAENSPDIIMRYDRECRRIYVNPAFVKEVGKTVEELLGGTPTEYSPLPQAVLYQQALQRVIASGEEIKHEYTWPTASGRIVVTDFRIVPERDADGQIASVLAIGRDITERQRIEDILREREHFLESLLDAIPIPVFYKDIEGRYLGINRGFETFFGATRQGMIGKSVFDTHPRELAEVYHAKDAEVFEMKGDIQYYESQIKHANGDLRDVFFNKAAFLDEGGEVKGLIGAVLDITERKRAEDALRDKFEQIVGLNDRLEENARSLEEQAVELETSQEQLKETIEFTKGIVNAIPDLLFEVDRHGRYLNVWTQHQARLTAGQDITLGQTVHQALAPDNAAIMMAGIREAEEKGLSFGKVVGIDLAEGKRWFEMSFSQKPGWDTSGVSFLVVSRDITERKRMEEALVAREQELRTLIANSPDTIARYDRACRRLYANPAFGALVEGGVAALLGKTPSQCPGGEHAAFFETKINEVFATGEDVEFELKWTGQDGRSVCSHFRLAPEFDVAGKLTSVLGVGRDITELNEQRERIHQMAFYDALTALPNRVLFNDRLHQMLIEAARHGQKAGVMLLDLDRFKMVNDTLGHPAGDRLLREAGARLASCLRDYDTVARLGGDEFAILLPEIRSADDVGRVANNILNIFKEPFMLEGKEAFVSTSIGIAVYPDDSLVADELIKQADSAMYSAKRSGRNAFHCYSADLTSSANERLMLEVDLRHGFERGELELYYQPKIRLADGALLGSEALLRWHHPTLGMVAPDKFIPIAEDCGQIIDIGAWVLREACRTASAWNGPGMALHKVAINLSARQFQSGNLLQILRDALDETNCRTAWIELEITESLLLDDNAKTLDVLDTFRAMGITIAIDDFGTGYSSLSYLARFPIDTLKIDRSFTSRVTQGRHHAELVKAMISIAHSLQQQVVAEGVETEEEAAFLRDHGCHVAQGYLFGRPVPKSAFPTKHQAAALPALTTDCS